MVTIAVQLLGELFWFILGYRALSGKIDRLREIVADQWAVKNGVEPAFLASALVKLKEIPENSDRFVLDGASFKQLNEVISGSFSAGAGANAPGVPVNAISLLLKAFLK